MESMSVKQFICLRRKNSSQVNLQFGASVKDLKILGIEGFAIKPWLVVLYILENKMRLFT